MTTATHKNKTYTAVYTAPELKPEPIEPWAPCELVRQMEAVGWVAQPDPGHYIHHNGYAININEPDKHGDPVWLTWAVAHMTPPPF